MNKQGRIGIIFSVIVMMAGCIVILTSHRLLGIFIIFCTSIGFFIATLKSFDKNPKK
jgi:hypothetical protein